MRTSTSYTIAVLRQWPIVIIIAILGVVGGLAYTRIAPPVYSSSAQVLVAVESSGSPSDRLQGATYVDQIIPTYTSAVSSSLILEPIRTQLDPEPSLDLLAKSVSAKATTGTALITITATASTAARAQSIARLVTARFIAVAPRLVSPVAAVLPTTGTANSTNTAGTVPAVVDLTVVDQPVAAPQPLSPSLLLALILGLVVGLLVGIGVALARFALDSRVRSLDRIEQIVGASIVGRLPRMSRSAWSSRDEDPLWAESVRSLRSALFAWGNPVRTIQFCASTPGEGTSSTVIALARSLASAGVHTVALDADLRSPSLAAGLNVSGAPGLADVLHGTAAIEKVGQWAPELTGLMVVPAGEFTASGDLLAGDLSQIFDDLCGASDVVLIDTPAVVTASDALAISHSVAEVILVVALGRVTEQVLRRTVEQITRGHSISGVIVTHADRSRLNESVSRVAVGMRL